MEDDRRVTNAEGVAQARAALRGKSPTPGPRRAGALPRSGPSAVNPIGDWSSESVAAEMAALSWAEEREGLLDRLASLEAEVIRLRSALGAIAADVARALDRPDRSH